MEMPDREPILERVPLSGPATLAFREFRLPAFRYPWHQHPEVELTWILKGSGLRYVGDSVEPFHEGDFCLLGPNVPHTWLTSRLDKMESGVRSLVVQFDPELWGRDVLGLPEFAAISDLLAQSAYGLCFGPGTTCLTRRKIWRPASPLERFTALLEALDELSRAPARKLCLAAHSLSARMQRDPRLHAVFTFISRHAGEPISQAEVAKRARLSPAAFSRFFRRAAGKTFQTYVTHLRLSEACRQLLESKLTISEIAFASGFGNLSNFNRSFRAVRGMSPGEFRRQANPPRAYGAN